LGGFVALIHWRNLYSGPNSEAHPDGNLRYRRKKERKMKRHQIVDCLTSFMLKTVGSERFQGSMNVRDSNEYLFPSQLSAFLGSIPSYRKKKMIIALSRGFARVMAIVPFIDQGWEQSHLVL
jgi:hypothetical protein